MSAAKMFVPDSVRLLIALAAVGLCWIIVAGDRASLGLALRPLQPWSYWCRVTLVIAGLTLVSIGVFAALVPLLHLEVAIPRTPPAESLSTFYHMCVTGPLYEEALYRIVLCAPLAAALGPRATILLGGVVFGLLHVVYGNPGPDNLIAGFFLGWAFLKSGTITVPLAWHSLGNGLALISHVINWYVF
jgi:CAAX protease family protein